jgi:hypothetical protein
MRKLRTSGLSWRSTRVARASSLLLCFLRVGGGGGGFKGPRSPLPIAGVKDSWVVATDVGLREVHLRPRRVLAIRHRLAAIGYRYGICIHNQTIHKQQTYV